jgi:hypothetical protein
MRSKPVTTGRLSDLTRWRLIEDAVRLPRAGAPVLGLDRKPLQRSFIAVRAEASEKIAAVLNRLVEENEGLVTYGAESIRLLHEQPLRRIELPDEHILLSAFTGDQGTHILESRWSATHNPGVAGVELEGGDLDELSFPVATAALTTELRRLAAISGFVPWKGYRIALVVGPRAERMMSGITQLLLVAGAVAGADVQLMPRGDLTDETFLARLAKLVEANRHQAVFSVSTPDERWVTRLMSKHSGRVPWIRLPFQDAELAVEQFDAAISSALDAAPGYPLFAWGDETFQRVHAFENAAFQVSDHARKDLRRNPYPDVERMLQHVELLALFAHRWHEEGSGGARVEDWVLEQFELDIALTDASLPTSWTVPYVRGDKRVVDLDARPHVRVDDATDRLHCGRIYFALERTERVVVLYQVGIHP